jgi:Zn-finger nucleic acid-binding protein
MKPHKAENEHIWVHEMQQRIATLSKEQQEKTDAEKQQLKEAHWMHCPKCGQKLAAESCGPLEIDVCPSCKGVWLDKGELGSIVESAGHGSFFRKCLQILRQDNPISPHLSPNP